MALAAVLLIRERRISKAVALGFVYDDNISHNRNKELAVALRAYAEHAADLYENTGMLPPRYIEMLADLGLSVKVIKNNNVYAIVNICCKICAALKV